MHGPCQSSRWIATRIAKVSSSNGLCLIRGNRHESDQRFNRNFLQKIAGLIGMRGRAVGQWAVGQWQWRQWGSGAVAWQWACMLLAFWDSS